MEGPQGPAISAKFLTGRVKKGEPFKLAIAIWNLDPIPLRVLDPRHSGKSLHLFITTRTQGNETREVVTTLPPLSMPLVSTPTIVPPRERREFLLDLQGLLPWAEPGEYILEVQWEWQQGVQWRSPSLYFRTEE